MQRFTHFIFALGVVAFFASCSAEVTTNEDAMADLEAQVNAALEDAGNDNTDTEPAPATGDMTMHDLNQWGIPVSISGPGDATVSDDMSDGDMKDVEIVKGTYAMNVVYYSREIDSDETPHTLYRDWMDMTESESGFEYVLEEDNGAIYKTDTGYDFYLATVHNGREIGYTAAVIFDDLGKEDVETLYNAAKTAQITE